MYRDTTNVEPEMYDYTGNNWVSQIKCEGNTVTLQGTEAYGTAEL
jgi:hypothetical protein